MTKKRLAKLRRELERLRNAKYAISPTDLVSLAKKLGRRKVKRGKHPTYVNESLPNSRPISIPGHPTINPYTAESIVDDLELDLERFSEMLERG